MVVVLDAPNDRAIAVAALAVAREGNTATRTMLAFSEEEFAQIMSELPLGAATGVS